MIVSHLYLVSIAAFPNEAHPILLVDSYTVLTRSVSGELL